MEASIFGYVEVEYPLGPREQADAYMRKITEIERQGCGFKGSDQRSRQALPREARAGRDPEEVSAGDGSRGREAGERTDAWREVDSQSRCSSRASRFARPMPTRS